MPAYIFLLRRMVEGKPTIKSASHLCIALSAREELTQHLSFGLQPLGNKLVFCPFYC